MVLIFTRVSDDLLVCVSIVCEHTMVDLDDDQSLVDKWFTMANNGLLRVLWAMMVSLACQSAQDHGKIMMIMVLDLVTSPRCPHLLCLGYPWNAPPLVTEVHTKKELLAAVQQHLKMSRTGG